MGSWKLLDKKKQHSRSLAGVASSYSKLDYMILTLGSLITGTLIAAISYAADQNGPFICSLFISGCAVGYNFIERALKKSAP